MNVYVFPDGDPNDPENFVAPIRLLEPLRALAQNYDVNFLCHRSSSESELFNADVVIVQRACFRSERELDHGLSLLTKARRSGTRIVYELDDHIFCPNLPELIADSEIDDLDEQAYELTKAHRQILEFADYLTCPTEPLACALKSLGTSAEVRVIATALDFNHERWDLSRHSSKLSDRKIHIGWSGGSRVGRDLEIVVQDLVNIARAYPQVTVVIAGATKYVRLFAEIPARQFLRVEWVDYNHYPSLLSLFDLALIPMQDHPYNRCKSALKVIDYAAVGVSSICSPVAPFSAFKRMLDTPVLAVDGEWFTCIEKFIHTHDANAHSNELAETTRRKYGLRGNLGEIWAVFREMSGAPLEETVC
jgi:O-antigen biosynthesis protein